MKRKGQLKITHGGSRFLKTGILPKGKLHIARLVDGVINEMIVDLGGEQEITASQKIIISAIRQNLIFLSLVNEWIAQQPSIIDKGQVLGPLNGFYMACQNTTTRECRGLGFKRFNPVDTLEKYLETKSQATTAVESGGPSSNRATPGKTVDPGASCEGEPCKQ